MSAIEEAEKQEHEARMRQVSDSEHSGDSRQIPYDNGSIGVDGAQDRFGDESHAAVRYKTMEWW
jgi:hypothetical protein